MSPPGEQQEQTSSVPVVTVSSEPGASVWSDLGGAIGNFFIGLFSFGAPTPHVQTVAVVPEATEIAHQGAVAECAPAQAEATPATAEASPSGQPAPSGQRVPCEPLQPPVSPKDSASSSETMPLGSPPPLVAVPSKGVTFATQLEEDSSGAPQLQKRVNKLMCVRPGVPPSRRPAGTGVWVCDLQLCASRMRGAHALRSPGRTLTRGACPARVPRSRPWLAATWARTIPLRSHGACPTTRSSRRFNTSR